MEMFLERGKKFWTDDLVKERKIPGIS